MSGRIITMNVVVGDELNVGHCTGRRLTNGERCITQKVKRILRCVDRDDELLAVTGYGAAW